MSGSENDVAMKKQETFTMVKHKQRQRSRSPIYQTTRPSKHRNIGNPELPNATVLEGPMGPVTDSAKASSTPRNPDFIATPRKHPAQNNVEALAFRPDGGGGGGGL
jgi:hypothetical protein